MNIKPSAGSNVETKCTRCNKILNHTIVAMVEEKIVRVECNTCHGVHNFHPVKPEKKPAATKSAGKTAVTRRTKSDSDTPSAADWEELTSGLDKAQAVQYDMGRTYRVKTLLMHATFGPGIIQAVLPNKIEVMFQGGKKLLRCG